jgi:hypothetical protein
MEHEKPNDFARYTSFGIIALLERNGFIIEKAEKTSSYIQAVTVLWANYIHHALLPGNRLLRWPLSLITIAPVNLFGGFLSWLLPNHPDLYLNHVIVARKPDPVRT